MNIKRNIIFALESRKKNDILVTENMPIRMRVIFGGKRIEFSTGYRVDDSKWDAVKQRVKNGCSNKLKQSAVDINADLQKYENIVQTIFKEFEVQEITPTPEQVKEAFADKLNPKTDKKQKQPSKKKEKKTDLFIVFDMFVRECGVQNNWTNSTYEKFAAVKNHLATFKKTSRLSSLTNTD